MLANDEFEKVKFQFARRSREYIDHMHQTFALLENWVDVRNKTAIRWLEWCGFKMEAPKPYGAYKLPFRRFWRRQETCVAQQQS